MITCIRIRHALAKGSDEVTISVLCFLTSEFVQSSRTRLASLEEFSLSQENFSEVRFVARESKSTG